ncbi:hypothetical protein SOVF_001480 [Spinacia oleracea]|uniref:Wall-associated receptor kinase-like 1 n=1 Tax=Spinacia oleracea TaxID=3562 RepID=A0A9R0JH91_SPIOL|nr:wall-associated receptor kinase-like 1 [Spinacia oleracea]KNA26003.1 hypothetical protein SOVF_001480 [Spinacia oleracea]
MEMSFMLLLLLPLLQSVLLQLTATSSSAAISKPDCKEQCGNVKIPYPFGIGPNCYHDKSYEITCDTSSRSPKPFLHMYNLEVMDINWLGKNHRLIDKMEDEQVLTVGIPLSDMCKSKVSIDFDGSPYRFSNWFNVLVVVGCGGSVNLKDRSGNILMGCATVCVNNIVDITKGCSGIGCCQASFITYNNILRQSSVSEYFYGKGLDFYRTDLDHEGNTSSCDMRVGLIDSRSVNKFSQSTVPTILKWKGPASYAQANTNQQRVNFSCQDESFSELSSFTCSCHYTHEGNPYLPYGCRVMRECRKCSHRCTWTEDPSHQYRRYYCEKIPLSQLGPVLGFSLGTVLIVLLLGCYWLYRVLKKRKEVRRKTEFFKRNGGLLLEQQIYSSEGASQKTKVFPVTELEKATDNFNKNRILGQGGQGTVYKGMLKDGRIVAIKKSKKVDENQLEQFINEVVILSETNHRNVVRLLGCCLETEVPLLVYEFIQNGSLYQHIHNTSEDFHITWKMRLQMAAESADAVAYLHSSSSAPIYHRDIKSSNILLDAKYRAKVSDFGTSRVIDIEQTHLTTCVIGTYGYLDPEYFQSQQFTEKSDVYSFGVVLVELITGKKPICPTPDGGWISLAVEFMSHMENSRLSDILDARVLNEGKEEEFVAVAELAKQCLNMNGKERPTMKEIAMVLDGIRSSPLPYSTEPNSMVGQGVMMRINDNQVGYLSTDTICSDFGPR